VYDVTMTEGRAAEARRWDELGTGFVRRLRVPMQAGGAHRVQPVGNPSGGQGSLGRAWWLTTAKANVRACVRTLSSFEQRNFELVL